MGVVMDLSDRVGGSRIRSTDRRRTPDEVQKNQRCIDAYLAVSH